MAYRNGGGRTLDGRGETRKAIHAELAKDDHATACGIVTRSSSPVLRLCRLLVDAGHDPGLPLEAWRNDVLCLRVRSIGEAAGLELNGDGTGFRPIRKPDAALPIHSNARDHAEIPPDWIELPHDEGSE